MPPPTLIATPGAADANAYATVAEADTYHSTLTFTAAWDGADADTKSAALQHATRVLDELVDWRGERATDDQALRWPRVSVYDRDGFLQDETIILAWLSQATAELARHLIDSDRTQDSSTLGFSALRAGPISVAVDPKRQPPVLPRSVRRMVEFYGVIVAPDTIVRTVRT